MISRRMPQEMVMQRLFVFREKKRNPCLCLKLSFPAPRAGTTPGSGPS